MNKFIKIILLSASLAAIVGIIFVGIGAVTGAKLGVRLRGTGIEIIENEKIKDSNLSLEEFSKIEADLGYADIVIEEGSEFGIEMLYYDSEYIPEYKIENGTLYITDNSKKEGFHNYMNLDLSFEFEKNLIKIYVPSGTVLKNTDIKLACGSIDLNSVLVESVKTSNGLGSTNIKLMNEAAEYSFDIGTVVGITSIDGKIKGLDYKEIVNDSDYTIEVKNNIGNVKINFED